MCKVLRMSDLSHFDEKGASRMVDVSGKPATERVAVASGLMVMKSETVSLVKNKEFSKGDVLEVARLAGIMAAKQTPQLIPLCHAIPISSVTIDFEFVDPESIHIVARVKTIGQTGVEMEAMTAVSAAALTVYDMCKSVDREITIAEIKLLEKHGGKSGHFVRPETSK